MIFIRDEQIVMIHDSIVIKDIACPFCSHKNQVVMKKDAFMAWQYGQPIQQAAPELSSDDRELLISGTCPGCWQRMFGEEEK